MKALIMLPLETGSAPSSTRPRPQEAQQHTLLPCVSTSTPKVVVPATFDPKVVVPATLTPGTTTTQCSRGGGRRRGHGKWSERDVLRRSWVVGAGSRRPLLWWVGEGKDGDESVGVKAMMSGVGMPGAGDKAPGTGKGSPQVWGVWGESPGGWPRAGPGAVGVTNKVRRAWELHQVPVEPCILAATPRLCLPKQGI